MIAHISFSCAESRERVGQTPSSTSNGRLLKSSRTTEYPRGTGHPRQPAPTPQSFSPSSSFRVTRNTPKSRLSFTQISFRTQGRCSAILSLAGCVFALLTVTHPDDLQILRVILFGIASLDKATVQTSTLGKMWGINELTPGSLAFAVIAVRCPSFFAVVRVLT